MTQETTRRGYFRNADHAGCQDTRKSTSRSMQLLGDRLVSWSSKKQKSTAISSTGDEYIALLGCLSTDRHLHQAFSTRTTGISHQKAWNAKHVPGDSEKAGRRRGIVMVIPFSKRVKVSSTNVRLETTVPQKEETFQVVIDLVKNSSCFKAFTISADVSEIFMPQFWYSVKKVQGTHSYEFLLANKKCVVNADVFRIILDICLRVEGVNFTNIPDNDTTLAFLIKLGYKGLMYKHTNMFVDHMHQPWRTLATIINKCLSGKTTSNDKLRKSKIDILWGMFYRENVTVFAYQIDHKKIRDKGHFHQEKYRQCSKGKKTAEESQETVDVSKESEPEPEPAKKKTSAKLKLKKQKAARKVHATHARIMIEYVPESAMKKSSGKGSKSVVIQDTLSTPKSKPATSKTKLKGAPSLTLQEQEAADIMQALKESKKTSRRQPDEEDSEFSDDDKDDVEKYDKDGNADDEGDDHVNEDVEMKDAEVEESDKGEEKVTDAAKEEAEKTSEAKDDTKKTELPPLRSSLSVSSGFGDQFLKLSPDSSLVSTVKDFADADVSSLLDIPIQHKLPRPSLHQYRRFPY
ncbi:hypothetical protein Tco_0242423 [Tanacetum coccineum]